MTISEEQLAELVSGTAEGDAESTAKLYRAFRRKFAFGTLQRLRNNDWEDVFHDAFVVVLQAIRGGKITKNAAILGYMKRVLERIEAAKIGLLMRDRMAIDTEALYHSHPSRDAILVGSLKAKDSPERDYARVEKVAIMIEELAHLKPRDREILQRFYLDGQKLEEIMAAMNLTWDQLRLSKTRAKKKLENAVALRLIFPSPQRIELPEPPKPHRRKRKEPKRPKAAKNPLLGKRIVQVAEVDGETFVYFSDGTTARIVGPETAALAA